MNKIRIIYVAVVQVSLTSCKNDRTVIKILQRSINPIDPFETVDYKQEIARSEHQNSNDSIFRYPEIYLKGPLTA